MLSNPRQLLHLRHQLNALKTMGQAALTITKRIDADDLPNFPGATYQAKVPKLSKRLVRDFLLHVGGDVEHYPETVPPHLFPQWCTPLLAKTLKNHSWNLTKILNGGCSMTLHHPIPVNRPLIVEARLESVIRKESMLVIEQQLSTGCADFPKALEVKQTSLLPFRTSTRSKRPSQSERVDQANVLPPEAREVGRLTLEKGVGFHFALLTGDFNPLHWMPWWAKASGYKAPINHGYSTLSRTFELLHRTIWATEKVSLSDAPCFGITHFDCRLSKPLLLPAEAVVWINNNDFYVTSDNVPSKGSASGSIVMSGSFR